MSRLSQLELPRRRPRLRPHRPGGAPGRHRAQRGGVVPHRPHRGGRRGARTHRHRLAGARRRAVLPGNRPPAHGPAPPPALLHARPPAAGHRRRALRRGSPRHRQRGRGTLRPARLQHPAGGARAGPHRPARRHRRHHPERAGRDHPVAAIGRPGGAGRSGHGQDGRGPASRRLPPLHVPLPARGPGRPGHRPATGCSSATSSACSPRWARPASSRWCCPTSSPTWASAGSTARSQPRSRATPAWRWSWPRRSRDRERPLKEDLVVPFGLMNLRLTVADSERIVQSAKRRYRRHNGARRFFEGEVYAALAASARQEVDPGEVRDRLRHTEEMRAALERMWPVLTPAQLLHDLFGSRALLRLAASKWLADDEVASLYRERSTVVREVAWSDADAALLDEARALLGSKPGRNGKGADDDEIRTYGHIVIDEVQDLSPMQLRMASRRSLNGSMTVVGDIAQATGTHAPRDWADVLAHLPDRRPARLTELTVGYRIPAQVMALAAQGPADHRAGPPAAHLRPGRRAPTRDPRCRTRGHRPGHRRHRDTAPVPGRGGQRRRGGPAVAPGHGRGCSAGGRRALRADRPHRARRGRERRAGPPREGPRARRCRRRRAGPHRERGAARAAGALRRAHPERPSSWLWCTPSRSPRRCSTTLVAPADRRDHGRAIPPRRHGSGRITRSGASGRRPRSGRALRQLPSPGRTGRQVLQLLRSGVAAVAVASDGAPAGRGRPGGGARRRQPPGVPGARTGPRAARGGHPHGPHHDGGDDHDALDGAGADTASHPRATDDPRADRRAGVGGQGCDHRGVATHRALTRARAGRSSPSTPRSCRTATSPRPGG